VEVGWVGVGLECMLNGFGGRGMGVIHGVTYVLSLLSVVWDGVDLGVHVHVLLVPFSFQVRGASSSLFDLKDQSEFHDFVSRDIFGIELC
jgi:hypothetical protein